MYRSPVLIPNAPSAIERATIDFIRSSSAGVGARFAVPITDRRIELWPARNATFIPSLRVATESRYAPNGHGPPPSGPPRASVTP